jgi:hypothetical protein
MYMKVHQSPTGKVVAVCDSELLGKKLSDGVRFLDLEAYASFYKGELVSDETAVGELAGAENLNLVGEKALAAAKKAGIDVRSAIRIGKVPHLQAYRI